VGVRKVKRQAGCAFSSDGVNEGEGGQGPGKKGGDLGGVVPLLLQDVTARGEGDQ
jgi:hypothetical protein